MAAEDVLFIAVILFSMAIGLFVVHYALNESVDALITNPSINQTNKTVTAFQDIEKVTNKFDYLIFGLFIALSLSLIITGYFIGGHPIFMFIYFIIVVIAVTISTVLSNSWEYITQLPIFSTTISSFPITNNLIIYLPIYVAVLGFIGIVIMFAKPYISGEQ